jgi:protein ImuB
MASRFAAIALPLVRVEIARAALAPEEGPLAVVIARADGAVKDEASLLGNTRLDEVSPEARALGIRAGQTIAAARARAADLRVRVVHVDAVRGVLAAVAEAALAFGAIVAFEAGGIAGDVVWADVTGCAHLFACKGDQEGERTLASKLRERVRAMGHVCRVAIADGLRVAAAVARFARGLAADCPALIVPPSSNAFAMCALPLAALPLDPRTVRWLGKVGIRVVGDLQRLPRRALGTRLGAAGPRVMQLLAGDDRERLVPHVPPEVIEESAELEYGIESVEALVFVCKRLADRVSARLEGRASKVARLVLAASLDRPRSEARKGGVLLELTLPTPLAKPDELLAVLRARLESYEVEAPILAVTLRAHDLAAAEGTLLDLFAPEAKAEHTLPRLGAELSAELGAPRVGTLALADTWIPEERTVLVPLAARPAVKSAARAALVSGGREPTRVLALRVPYRERHAMRLLERVEAVEWWRRGTGGKSYYAGWAEAARALAWVALDHVTGEARVEGWLD